MKSTTLSHIIIQAGGRGSRLEELTNNKPKALVSVQGEPLIINQMRKAPKAKFFVIADYQREVFSKYLRIFAPATYKIIETDAKHTCSGVKKALKNIPDNTPFIILWCDLYFKGELLPRNILPRQHNYIGLSNTFPCRWSFKARTLVEEKSASRGVAGFFIFKNKKEISDVPTDGEFCRYLQEKKISFKPFILKNVYEVGTKEAYHHVTKEFPHTRPFNKLLVKKTKVVKIAVDQQGKKLARFESKWYQAVKGKNVSFLPKIDKTTPLTIQKISGQPLYYYSFSLSQKKKILKKIITDLKELHTLFPRKKGSVSNDHEAILGKTKKRLSSIAPLIPDIDKDYIFINKKKCLNFYKKWNTVEQMLTPFFGNSYSFIHGDVTFSNMLYEEATQNTYLIDPRGYYGKSLLYGDEDYDWAKLYYSLVGNYDAFNNKKFHLSQDGKNTSLEIETNHWEALEDVFFDEIQRDKKKIQAYHAIIWLSLASYAWDDYDSILGAFYNGTYLMQKFYEKTV